MLFSLTFQLLFRTKAPECVTGLDQTQSVLLIYGKALRLPVRASGSADVRAFVPIYPQPSQVLKDLIFVLGSGTLPISVLNPENVSAVLLPGEKPRKQAGPYVANMKQACRTGCETNSNHGIWKPEGQTQKI